MEFIINQRRKGYVTFIALIVTIICSMFLFYLINFFNYQYDAIYIKKSLDKATKAVATMVDLNQLKDGKYKIDPNRALPVYQTLLNKNLGLNNQIILQKVNIPISNVFVYSYSGYEQPNTNYSKLYKTPRIYLFIFNMPDYTTSDVNTVTQYYQIIKQGLLSVTITSDTNQDIKIKNTILQQLTGSDLNGVQKYNIKQITDTRSIAITIAEIPVNYFGGILSKYYRFSIARLNHKPVNVATVNNHPPVVTNISFSPTTIDTNTKITWSYTAIDPDGDKIINVEWDGKQEQYAVPGDYMVRCRVQDSRGLWSNWTSVTIHVMQPIQYLYLNGDENTSVTGGWIIRNPPTTATYDHPLDTIVKQSSSLYLKATAKNIDHYYLYGVFVTNSQINFYNRVLKIHFKKLNRSSTVWQGMYLTRFFVALIPSANLDANHDAAANQIFYYSTMNISTFNTSNVSLTDYTLTVPTQNITQPANLMIGALVDWPSGNSIELEIDKIWLEDAQASSTGNSAPIITAITMNPSTDIDTKTIITWGYNAYDPDGDAIVNEEWQGKQSQYTIPGTYTVQCRVQDSKGNWSNWSSITFTVLNPNLVLNPIAQNDLSYIKLTGSSYGGTISRSTSIPAGLGITTGVFANVSNDYDFNIAFGSNGINTFDGYAIPVSPNKVYYVGAWVYLSNTITSAQLRPIEWTSTGGVANDTVVTSTTTKGQWVKLEGYITTKSNTNYLTLRVRLYGTGTAYITKATVRLVN